MMIAMPLEILTQICSQCACQFSLLSIITPRNFVCYASFTLWPSILIITPEDNMPRQRKITDFPGSNSVSSPAVNQEADIDQSHVSNEINPSSPTSKAPSSNSSKDPPRRTGLKRKKVIKEQRRRARRRVNQPRKCKVTRHDDDSTPQRTTVTPMPSPNGSPNPFDPDNVVCDNPTPLHNRSLTDMLASAAAASPVNSTSNSQSKDDIASAHVRRLESQFQQQH